MDATVPLANLEAERAVLGAILVNNAQLVPVTALLTEKDFFRDAHRRIYRHLIALDASGTPIDHVTLKDALFASGELDDAGGPVYVASLGDGMPRAANAVSYAKIVKEKADLREFRAVLQRFVAATEAHDAVFADLVTRVEQALADLRARPTHTPWWVSGETLAADMRSLIEAATEHPRGLRGRSTGLPDVDDLTLGLRPGEVIALGARPGMGKTALALQIAMHVAHDAPVLVFSLEMELQALGLRIVSALAEVDQQRLALGRLTDSEQQRIGVALLTLGGRPIFFDRAAVRTVSQVRSCVRQLRLHAGELGLVAIDYLQLLEPTPEDSRQPRAVAVGNMSRAVKALAKECHVPVLLLAQLNRSLEQRADKQPALADFRESGAIEQDADLVWLLHRPEVYSHEPEDAGLAILDIAKNRNGQTGTVQLTWDGSTQRFVTTLDAPVRP